MKFVIKYNSKENSLWEVQDHIKIQIIAKFNLQMEYQEITQLISSYPRVKVVLWRKKTSSMQKMKREKGLIIIIVIIN